MIPGQRIEYGNGESVTLLEVKPGLFSATALIKTDYRDMRQLSDLDVRPDGSIDTKRLPVRTMLRWTELAVHWLHPNYRFQHVAFIPS